MRFAWLLLLFAGVLSSCGFKGPPLPPLADTPEENDRLEEARATPSPSPSTAPKTKKKRKSQ